MSKLAGVLVASVAGLSLVGLAIAGINNNWSTHANGSMEVPVRDSQGQAQAIFHLSPDGTSLDFTLNASNIEGVTQAHIHCGEAGVNGPVVAFLFGFDPAGVAPNGKLSEGTITNADVIPRAPGTPGCPDGVANFDELIDRLNSGDAYVNVHTLVFPGGEIRGDITAG
jgi:hypothetical protein